MIRTKPSEAARPQWRFCGFSCRTSWRNHNFPIHHKWSETQRKNFIKAITGKPNFKLRESIKGDKHWNWQGGKTRETIRLRNSAQAREWRAVVFERDKYTCQECGDRNGNGHKVILNADHIKPWAYFPELRFDISNGRTLCLPCHLKTDTFSWRAKTFAGK